LLLVPRLLARPAAPLLAVRLTLVFDSIQS
jgi:hypothetical protein